MANTAAAVLRRALLYVPGSSQKMLQKSRNMTGVDCVCYDLEDSVTKEKKPEARKNLAALLKLPRAEGIREQAVRINAVETGMALDDLTEVLQAPNIDTIVIPKVNSASDLHFVTDILRHLLPARHPNNVPEIQSPSPPLNIIALVESARSLQNLSSICASSPYLSGLIFAAEDFAHDLSLTRTPSLNEFLYARSAIATAARAFNLPSTIDLVCTAYKGAEGLRVLEEECIGGKGLGFNGKQCIHPSQVEVVQKAFGPSKAEVEWGVRLLIANAKAEEAGRGAWTMDGKMIDMPVVKKAEAIVERAESCGIDVKGVRDMWKEQQPE